MPRFSITKAGIHVGQFEARGDRIELGSERSCHVVIEDVLIAAHQVTFSRTSQMVRYQIVPVPSGSTITLNGEVVLAPVEVTDGAVFSIAGYMVKVDYLAGELLPLLLNYDEPRAYTVPGMLPDGPSAAPSSTLEANAGSAPDQQIVLPTGPSPEIASTDRMFVPLTEPRRGGRIPSWGWFLAGVGVLLFVEIILLIAL